MKRPVIGAIVREGARTGVVVGHPGRGPMTDVQFRDVDFVERRDAARLKVEAASPADAKRQAAVQKVYQGLVNRKLGMKSFHDAKGHRADVKAVLRGDLNHEDIDALVGRAFGIVTAQGIEARDPTGQLHDDYEITLVLRRAPAMPRRRNGVGSLAAQAARGVASYGGRAASAAKKLVPYLAGSTAAAAAIQYGKMGLDAARAYLATPEGKRMAAQIVGTASTVLGAEAVQRGKLSKKDAALVRRAIERQTGEKVDADLVDAAISLHAKTRANPRKVRR